VTGAGTVVTVGGRADRRSGAFGRWLVLFALGYAFFHHVGSILAGLGDVSDTQTRWADWADLCTPYVVVGAAAGALRAGRAGRGAWTVFGLGALLYTQGQGIHLAANSVSNAAPGEPAHLWDETVGHYLWYAGFALIVVSLAVTLAGRGPRGGVGAQLLALLVGFTHFTNSVEGQTVALGIGTAVLFALWGLRTRDGMGRVLLTAYGFSLVLFAVFGVWQGGFPQFSELGWI
jgi:hypothetical protein